MPKITTFLTYDSQAEEAANHYASIFPNSAIRHIARYREGAPAPVGSVMTVVFELDGREFVALNGGPYFSFSEGVSLSVECETQDEIDHYWNRLSEGGEEGPCGWLKDKFGLSWQVVPRRLGELVSDPDAAKARRVFSAMLEMKKMVIAELERAYTG